MHVTRPRPRRQVVPLRGLLAARPHDGRVWAAANGKTVVDYQGQTQKDSGLYVWWPFKVYVGTALEQFGGRPIYQWMDDVEFASEPPNPLPPVAREDSFSCQD